MWPSNGPSGAAKSQRFPHTARHQALLNGYWLPINFQIAALLTIAVPAALSRFRNHTEAQALLTSAAAVVAMIVPPIAGAVSDRFRALGTKRRTAIYLGALINAAALVWAGFAGTAPPFAAAVLLSVVGQSISLAAYQALIPELVAAEDWGYASGYQGVASIVGSVAGLAVASLTSPSTTFLITAAVVATGTLTVAATPEVAYVEIDRVTVRDWHDFTIAFISRLWTVFGLTLLTVFVLYFFQDALKVRNPSATTGLFGILSLAGAIVSSVWFGVLSDRTSRKQIVALSGALMALAVLAFALFGDIRFVIVSALIFGLGYGGIASTGWALAIDSAPQIRNVARDLGIWGIASNLPAVFAPLFGWWLVARYATPASGYRALFVAASLTFLIGSAIVLAVRGRRPARPWGICFQTIACMAINPYYRTVNRVRNFGRLPFHRGATIVIANHQHDLDDTVIVTYLQLCGRWHRPIYTTASRRMFEPGFIAWRNPWLRWFIPKLNLSWLFSKLGLLPIENDLFGKSVAGLAWQLQQLHGDLPLVDVFTDRALVAAEIVSGGRRLSSLFDAGAQRRAYDTRISLNGLREPYRSEILASLRAQVKADLERIEEVLRGGATFYLTPEGRHTKDGKLGRLRLEVKVMAPLASVYLAAVSYDVFVGRRLDMIFRIVAPWDPADIPTSLKAARPVTVSQLFAAWLAGRPIAEFTADEAVTAVSDRLAQLPASAFVEPSLQADAPRMACAALAGMVRLGTLVATDSRYRLSGRHLHPRFPDVADTIQYQANMFAETIEALRLIEARSKIPAEVRA